MALTTKQAEVMDVLFNGGYIWRAGDTFFLARATHHSYGVNYQSRKINAKTAKAVIDTDLVESHADGRYFAKHS